MNQPTCQQRGRIPLTDCARTEVAIIGAGPAGLAAACACRRRHLDALVLDRKGLAQSVVEYPQCLRFFSPPDEMEIDGIPLPVAGGEKPTRETYLAYLRGVARFAGLKLATWEAVETCERLPDGGFLLHTACRPAGSGKRRIRCRAIILATGVWHTPVSLNCSGSDRDNVISEFHEPTPFFGQDVLVVGGGNSAVGAALSLMEAGARVRLSMRRPPKDYRSGLRPYVRRNLGFAVEEERVELLANTRVIEIGADYVTLRPVQYKGSEDLSEGVDADYEITGHPFRVPCRFVFSLIGHRPDRLFFENVFGLPTRTGGRPRASRSTWETDVPGIFVAGSLADESLDVVLKMRRQAADVVDGIQQRLRPLHQRER